MPDNSIFRDGGVTRKPLIYLWGARVFRNGGASQNPLILLETRMGARAAIYYVYKGGRPLGAATRLEGKRLKRATSGARRYSEGAS